MAKSRLLFFIHEAIVTWLEIFSAQFHHVKFRKKKTYGKILLGNVKINFKAMVSQSYLSKERRQQKVQPRKTCEDLYNVERLISRPEWNTFIKKNQHIVVCVPFRDLKFLSWSRDSLFLFQPMSRCRQNYVWNIYVSSKFYIPCGNLNIYSSSEHQTL